MQARRFPALGLALLVLTASGLSGQNRVQIVGTVLDDKSDEPIAGVDIAVRNVHERFLEHAVSDEQGRFSVMVYRTSAVRIYAAGFGYQRTTTPLLHFDGKQYFEVKLRLHPEAIVLAPLEVVASARSSGSPFLSGFRQRLASGAGHYITRAQIEERRPVFVSDILRDVPGVRFSSSGRGSRAVVHMSRSQGLACSVQLFVDGRLMTRGSDAMGGFSVDDFVEPASIEGIEVYRGLSTVPAEFYNHDAKCGVVAIWTRRGDG